MFLIGGALCWGGQMKNSPQVLKLPFLNDWMYTGMKAMKFHWSQTSRVEDWRTVNHHRVQLTPPVSQYETGNRERKIGRTEKQQRLKVKLRKMIGFSVTASHTSKAGFPVSHFLILIVFAISFVCKNNNPVPPQQLVRVRKWRPDVENSYLELLIAIIEFLFYFLTKSW